MAKSKTKKIQKIRRLQQLLNYRTVGMSVAALVVVAVSFVGVYNYGASSAAKGHPGGGGGTPTAAAGTLALSPASGRFTPGTAIPVVVVANTGTVGINAAQTKILYDTNKLDFVGIEEIGPMEQVAATDTGTPGVIQIARATQGAPLTGSFSLVQLDFVVKQGASGSAVVSFDTANSFLVEAATSANILTGTTSAVYTLRNH